VGVTHGFWDQGIVGYLIPIVSQSYWDSLDEDQQATFSKVWNATVEKQREMAIEQDGEYRATLAEWGVTISDASDEASATARDAMMPIQAGLVDKLEISDEVMSLAEEAAK
jgi:TRAP-type C4-dicarboxylate transport system substrate-binding protein